MDRNEIRWDAPLLNNMRSRYDRLIKTGKPVDWNGYEHFLKWCKRTFEPGTRLSRIDESKPYGPNNCTWEPMGDNT